jgi:hypothetical protein
VKTDKGEEFLRGRFICISDTKPCWFTYTLSWIFSLNVIDLF